jgi:hypothetical protein
VVLAQQASGLRPGEFCSKENICPTSFYTWRKRLGLVPQVPAGTLLSDVGGEKTGPGHEPKGFMRVVPPQEVASRVIRIELPNGYRVAMDYIGEDGLKQLLEILRCM